MPLPIVEPTSGLGKRYCSTVNSFIMLVTDALAGSTSAAFSMSFFLLDLACAVP